MKKSTIFSLVICLILINQLDAQKGSLLKKIGNSMANELLGRKEKAEPEPEPASACAQPDVIMDMGGKYKLNYKEVNISVTSDGRVLIQDNVTGWLAVAAYQIHNPNLSLTFLVQLSIL